MIQVATSEAMGELKFVLIKNGTQFVMNTGTVMMQVLCAVSWDSPLMVSAPLAKSIIYNNHS